MSSTIDMFKNDWNDIANTNEVTNTDELFENSNLHADENKKKEKCSCKKEMDIDVMIDMIYFLREKQVYRTFKERFFDCGTEYIHEIRVDTKKKISDSRLEISMFVNQLNDTFKKYHINTCLRRIHFLAQSYLETASFRSTFENRATVPGNYMGGVDFQGRGIKQITHDYNYLAYYDYVNGSNWLKDIYEKYRVRITIGKKKRYESVEEFIMTNPKASENGMNATFYDNLKVFAKQLSQDLFYAFDSAGWYVGIHTATLAEMDKDDVLRVSRIINTGNANSGNPNDLDKRENYTMWLKDFFGYSKNCQ